MPVLEILSGNHEGTQQTFDNELRIGSSKDNELCLSDNGISRNHAVVYAKDGRFEVQDLGSSNGTYINFRRLNKEESSRLQDRDIVFCGRTVIKFWVDKPRASSSNGSAGPGAVSEEELRDLLRGTIPLKALMESKDKTLVEAARKIILRAEQAEVMRRLGLHMLSAEDLKKIMDQARA